MSTRRNVLRAGGTAFTGLVGLSLSGTGRADAGHEDGDWEAKPSDVTIEFDESVLETYRPALVSSRKVREAYVGLYGYVVRGDGYDHDVCCYWSQLSIQNGTWFLTADSHLGDHEPIYLFVDPETGEVDQVVYSSWHHFPNQESPETAKFRQEEHPDHETHVVLEIDDRWHNYHIGPDADGTLDWPDVENWLDERDSWKQNGFYEDTAAEAIEDPETMLDRPAWWDESTLDYTIGRWLYRFGAYGGGQADEIRDQ